eukprot:GFUD01018967.1.p1 GENE.GFUD01018967.1~~GFUD01018967.1.p1  ORF type:complete len:267 (+),score=71.52 GFUD01018967.1:95-895(+)
MDQSALNEHYRNLANKYDSSYSNATAVGDSKGQYDFLGEKGARIIMELMDMKVDDRMVDLGAGTCKTAGMIAQMAGLKHPVLCVDPVQEMLEVANKNNVPNIETLCATAEDFSRKDVKYDKILIKGAIHHFPVNKMREIFTGIKTQLNDKGVILIDKSATSTTEEGMPFFKKGILIQRQMNAALDGLLENLLKDLGFQVDKQIIHGDKNMSKDEAIQMIKNRGISGLSVLSDDELKEGIEEVESKYEGCSVIEWKNKREMIIACKH